MNRSNIPFVFRRLAKEFDLLCTTVVSDSGIMFRPKLLNPKRVEIEPTRSETTHGETTHDETTRSETTHDETKNPSTDQSHYDLLYEEFIQTFSKQSLNELKKDLENPLAMPLEWIGVFSGECLKNTFYEGGVFILDIKVPNEYPFKPPVIKYITPIFHCNVTKCGAISLNILSDSWSPALTIGNCLECVCSLLREPNFYDPVLTDQAWVKDDSIDLGMYNRIVEIHTKVYADPWVSLKKYLQHKKHF